MGLFKIEAYKCEWCGRIFPSNRNYHESECKYDPNARSCISCVFHRELVKDWSQDPQMEKAAGAYCPRRNQVFIYPHKKYCPDYKKDPNFISHREEE